MNLTTPLVATAAALFASGCEPTWFAVEIEATEVCVVDMPVVFPPAELTTSMQTSISQDDLGVNLSEAIDLEIEVASVAMAPAAQSDLRFAGEVNIRMASAEDATLPVVSLVKLSESELAPAGGLYGEPESRIDVTAYIQASDVVFEFELAGGLPKNAVPARMDLCVDITAGYSESVGEEEKKGP